MNNSEYGRFLMIIMGIVLMTGLALPAWALDQDSIAIDGQDDRYRLSVEIAHTPEERAFGLMERDQLPRSAGMLFVYPREQPSTSGFWMYRTRIPLDIAFLGKDGEIRAIRAMPPCDSEHAADCPVYPAGVPFHSALEVNRGYFEERGIEVGDHVTLP